MPGREIRYHSHLGFLVNVTCCDYCDWWIRGIVDVLIWDMLTGRGITAALVLVPWFTYSRSKEPDFMFTGKVGRRCLIRCRLLTIIR